MDTKINRSLVQSLRKQRSWSQDELAVASGLNLRTIQRIERSGVGSLQSRKALAAAFNIEVKDLESPEESMATKYEYRVVRFDMTWGRLATKLSTDFGEIESQINGLGAEGWELVALVPIIGAATPTTALIATFKKAIV
jgi:transcriptional regulator with XRE-family HTH domain